MQYTYICRYVWSINAVKGRCVNPHITCHVDLIATDSVNINTLMLNHQECMDGVTILTASHLLTCCHMRECHGKFQHEDHKRSNDIMTYHNQSTIPLPFPLRKQGFIIHIYIYIPSSKLTWHWKIIMFNRRYIFKWLGFPLSCWLFSGVHAYLQYVQYTEFPHRS